MVQAENPIAYLVLLVGLVIWIGYNLIKHNRTTSYASDSWTARHIDSQGNYRA